MALACAVALALLAAAPATAAAPGITATAARDPLLDLGAKSPSCAANVGAQAKRNCAGSGSIAHPYPLNAYGFDVQIGFSLGHLDRSFLGALQSIGALIWMALVYVLKGVLLLLEWGFSIDLLGASMTEVRRTLATLHDHVIGQPWFLAALAVTALWGIWRGLVQRQATRTITGLAATVGLMVCGLVILARPDDTVGYASRLANDASLGVLSAATSQQLDRPVRSLADATIGIFDATVRDPWCALEFGSVTYCARHAKGSRTLTNADVWLAYPAQSGERKALYRLLKGQNPDGNSRGLIGTLTHPALDLVGLGGDKPTHLPAGVKRLVGKDPRRAAMQEAGATFPRFALLALIALGMTGAAALLAYLGIRLLLASVLALLLLLFAPAVLLAPAFGESGRATFVAWSKRLVGAIATKLVYALFLAVVLAGGAAVRHLSIGWFGTWLLEIAFWWGVLLKRHELIGFVSVPGNDAHRSGLHSALAQGYYAMQLGRGVRTTARRLSSTPRRGLAVAMTRREDAREHRATAAGQLAADAMDADGRRALTAQQERAREALEERRQAERELRVIDRKLAGFDEAHATTRATAMPPPLPTAEQAVLVRRRRQLLDRLSSRELRAAGHVLAHADRNRAQTGGAITARDLAAYRRQRAADLAGDLPLDHERHLQAAGIEPETLRRADDRQRAELLRRVAQHLDRERDLLAALPVDAAGSPGAMEPARIHVDPDAFRARVAEQRARARRERRARRFRVPTGRR
jgi:hypothetical protein